MQSLLKVICMVAELPELEPAVAAAAAKRTGRAKKTPGLKPGAVSHQPGRRNMQVAIAV
jgi:hypothetical protein